jgi:adenylate cyclase
MERALLIDPDNLLMRYNFACVLSQSLHDADGAIGMLESVLDRCPDAMVGYAKIDTSLDPLREDPRFVTMLSAAEARVAT